MEAAIKVHHHYEAEFRDADGNLVWRDTIDNLVVDAWLTNILSIIYGSTAKVTNYYVGLVTGPGNGNTYAAGDAMNAHGGWTEASPYSNGSRPACTWPATGANKSISNSVSPAVFNINGNGTIAGCFLATDNQKGAGNGTLCGVGNFGSGDKAVSANGTLTVTVTATAA
jgi:hypothetical protein